MLSYTVDYNYNYCRILLPAMSRWIEGWRTTQLTGPEEARELFAKIKLFVFRIVYTSLLNWGQLTVVVRRTRQTGGQTHVQLHLTPRVIIWNWPFEDQLHQFDFYGKEFMSFTIHLMATEWTLICVPPLRRRWTIAFWSPFTGRTAG